MLSEQELLEMERPVSARHAPMRRCDRAAQFAPFAALSGFGEAVQEAGRLVRQAGWQVENIDSTVVAQRPRLAPYIPQMRARIAAALGLAPAQVSVKGKTEEGLGFTGAGEGIAAHAVCLITKA